MSELPEKDLPPGRHRLLKEHLMTEIRQESPRTERTARARRPWLRPVLVGAAAAAVAGGVLVALPSGTEQNTAVKHTSDEAVALLEDIALATAERDAPEIRDDQYVYVKSRVAYSSQQLTASDQELSKPKLDPVHDREVWFSVDGKRPGLLVEENRNGRIELEAEKPGLATNTSYRNLTTLPTDPDAMLKWLYKNRQGDNQKDHQAFITFGDLVRESLVPPAQGAALYRAAAKLPAVEVVKDVKDAAGRTGVAVSREDEHGLQTQLIFNPKTFAYLGERVVATRETEDGLEEGDVTGTAAVLDREVVDKVEQRP
ncbi:CU044_5270 family protein [Streptomyces sp. NPDC049906]|uniref:CU044_5270 family protein n=1 Tax=Streptomyces sp. NPDC049906 TaxID=3155656 RepID=UPI003449C96B